VLTCHTALSDCHDTLTLQCHDTLTCFLRKTAHEVRGQEVPSKQSLLAASRVRPAPAPQRTQTQKETLKQTQRQGQRQRQRTGKRGTQEVAASKEQHQKILSHAFPLDTNRRTLTSSTPTASPPHTCTGLMAPLERFMISPIKTVSSFLVALEPGPSPVFVGVLRLRFEGRLYDELRPIWMGCGRRREKEAVGAEEKRGQL